MHASFHSFARNASHAAGSPSAFYTAISLVALWCFLGPFFQFSSTWQLAINTVTTIVTFVMVFLIQNAQNRESLALQLKIDELIRSMAGARIGMLDLEQLSDKELAALEVQFRELARAKRDSVEQPRPDNPIE